MRHATRPLGELLREWRRRRRLSQLELAYDADISPRHLSFLETGRSQPSREMVLRLAEQLDIPLRERNTFLTAAGFAPVFGERSLSDPAMDAARQAVDLVLAGHEPYPALAVDRHWTLLASNQAIPRLLAGVDPSLLRPPVNVLRLSLHPDGLAPRILNLRQWRAHLLERLRRQMEATADPELSALRQELCEYPVSGEDTDAPLGEDDVRVITPLRLSLPSGPLALFSTTTIFGTPSDVTLSEIALECFYPADPASATTLYDLAKTG